MTYITKSLHNIYYQTLSDIEAAQGDSKKSKFEKELDFKNKKNACSLKSTQDFRSENRKTGIKNYKQ